MGKYQKQKQKKKSSAGLIALIIVLAVITLAAFVLFVMPQLLYQESGDAEVPATEAPAQTGAAPAETEADAAAGEAPKADVFPLTLGEGELAVESLFQFDGINPDAGNQEGTDIASIVLKNTSGKYLDEATVTLHLEDGTALNFTAMDLPAGKSAMAFSTENASIEADAECVSWEYEAAFDEEAVTESQQVDISVDGVTVTVTNVSEEDISEIVIYCRCPFDEEYFGGVAYEYTINDLAAGESTAVEALDCILGMAEVVRIAIN